MQPSSSTWTMPAMPVMHREPQNPGYAQTGFNLSDPDPSSWPSWPSHSSGSLAARMPNWNTARGQHPSSFSLGQAASQLRSQPDFMDQAQQSFQGQPVSLLDLPRTWPRQGPAQVATKQPLWPSLATTVLKASELTTSSNSEQAVKGTNLAPDKRQRPAVDTEGHMPQSHGEESMPKQVDNRRTRNHSFTPASSEPFSLDSYCLQERASKARLSFSSHNEEAANHRALKTYQDTV